MSAPVYTCEEIRSDGAHRFETTDDRAASYNRTIWLMGIDRPRGIVEVGDKGTMTYLSDLRGGRYVFEAQP